jgi:hypothetical protein
MDGELLVLARSCSRDEFVKRFDHPFLVRPRLASTGAGAGPSSEDAITEVRAMDRITEERQSAGGVRYVPLVRNLQSPYTDRITVGRTGNCDVVLSDRSVSKLHALFWPAPELADWAVSDARSANGTWLNDRKLPPLERALLKRGDTLRLGHVEVRFIDASLLYELLVRRAAAR